MINEQIKDIERILDMPEEEARKQIEKLTPDISPSFIESCKYGWIEYRLRELFDLLRGTATADHEPVAALLELLTMTIRHTRAGDDVRELKRNGEYIEVYFKNSQSPNRKIFVGADSGIAMIRDILNNIDIG